MRVGIISDIHGNLAALDAVLSALGSHSPDRLVCLGDVAATGPQPRECLARLAAVGCPVVLGNTDADLLNPNGIDPGHDSTAARIADIDRWCAAELGEPERAFLRTFAPTISISLDGGASLLAVHGGPNSFHDVILATTSEDDLDRLLAGHTLDLVAAGHTHVPMVRTHRRTTLLNPGSVGLAYLADAGGTRVPPWAEYAVLTVDGPAARHLDLRRCPYDRATTVRAMVDRGMPHAGWWASDWA